MEKIVMQIFLTILHVANIVIEDDSDEDDTEHEIDSDDEEEYHEADNEESDGVNDKDAGMQGKTSREENSNDADNSNEYEMIPISENGRRLGKKRYCKTNTTYLYLCC